MEVKEIVWLGVRTSNFDAMVNLYRGVMGLEIPHQEPGFVVMDLPNAARAEMEANGIEFMGPIETAEDGNAWSHFPAPDGFTCELT